MGSLPHLILEVTTLRRRTQWRRVTWGFCAVEEGGEVRRVGQYRRQYVGQHGSLRCYQRTVLCKLLQPETRMLSR
jgi:hypothetical protein